MNLPSWWHAFPYQFATAHRMVDGWIVVAVWWIPT